MSSSLSFVGEERGEEDSGVGGLLNDSLDDFLREYYGEENLSWGSNSKAEEKKKSASSSPAAVDIDEAAAAASPAAAAAAAASPAAAAATSSSSPPSPLAEVPLVEDDGDGGGCGVHLREVRSETSVGGVSYEIVFAAGNKTNNPDTAAAAAAASSSSVPSALLKIRVVGVVADDLRRRNLELEGEVRLLRREVDELRLKLDLL